MVLHLGGGVSVPLKNIVSIMDIEKASTSRDTKDFLARAGKHKRVIAVTEDLPKSFVVSIDKNLTETVYICGVSAETLRKRLQNIFDIV